MTKKNLKIAYFSPFSPIKSGISYYSESLVSELAKHCEITIITDGYTAQSENLPKNIAQQDFQKIKNLKEFMSQFDEYLYHMGNHIYHHYIYETLKEYPGITVMHDYTIHNLIAAQYLHIENDFSKYYKEITACGISLTGTPEYPIEKNHNPITFMWEKEALNYPVNQIMIRKSKGIITHSHYCKKLIYLNSPESPQVKVIPHFSFPEKYPETRPEKNPDTTYIGTFGLGVPNKKIHLIIKTIAKLKSTGKKIICNVVGEFSTKEYEKEIKKLIKSLHLEKEIFLRGFVSEKELYHYLDLTDICVNLRHPTLGETSGSLIRILARKKATIVSNDGWYGELPDDCVEKVNTDDKREPIEFEEKLTKLIEDTHARIQMSENAAQYINKECGLKKITNSYLDFIEYIHEYDTYKTELLTSVAQTMDELGITPEKKIHDTFNMIAADLNEIIF